MYALTSMTTGTKIDSAVVANLYNGKLTVGALEDVDASSAKIVDVDFALNSWNDDTMVETTSLLGLMGATNATVAVYYTEANGVATINTIYVLSQAVPA